MLPSPVEASLPAYLGGVNNAGLHEVLILAGGRVVAKVGVAILQHPLHDHAAVVARVVGNQLQAVRQGALDNVGADLQPARRAGKGRKGCGVRLKCGGRRLCS